MQPKALLGVAGDMLTLLFASVFAQAKIEPSTLPLDSSVCRTWYAVATNGVDIQQWLVLKPDGTYAYASVRPKGERERTTGRFAFRVFGREGGPFAGTSYLTLDERQRLLFVPPKAASALGAPGPLLSDIVTTLWVPDEQADLYLSIHKSDSGNARSHPAMVPPELWSDIGVGATPPTICSAFAGFVPNVFQV